ncbi:MAG: multicopper oxidase family protein, partial [Gammaproteobacteria bacterium]
MSAPTTRKATTMNRMLPLLAAAAGSLLAAAAQAAAPGISGTTFNLSASPAYLTQPDGLSVYSWGYGCTGGALAAGQSFVPATTTTPFCTTMQIPGPTLVVTEGQSVTVVLTNNLPASAGNTSMLFPGFTL